MDDKPTRLPGFLALLSKTTDDIPVIHTIVQKMISERSFSDVLRYYEIRDEKMLRSLIDHVAAAVDNKMQTDFEHHRVGSTSFRNVIYQAVAFALVAGAQLAKDKKI